MPYTHAPADPVTPLDDVTDFPGYFRLERLGEDAFGGFCHVGGPQRAFGGHLAAQALAAACRTVDGTGVSAHSLHGHFLSAAVLDRRIDYRVERLRDTRSYATRRVTAVQGDRPVFTLTASFKSPEAAGDDRSQGMPDVLGPEDLPDPYSVWAANNPAEFDEAVYHHVVSMRFVPPTWRRPAEPGVTEHRQWVRASRPLPDDAALHACALTYLADLTLAPAAARSHEEPRVLREGPGRVFKASLDHSIWIHRPFRADEWLLFDLRSPTGADGRALATGGVFTRDGRLVATVAQELVIRPLGDAPSTAGDRTALR